MSRQAISVVRLLAASLAIVAWVSLVSRVSAAIPTWDTSSAAGFSAGNGIWGSDNFWTTDGTTLGAWVANSDAAFVASGASAITVSGTQYAGNLKFDGTGYALSGGTVNLSGGTIEVNAASASIASAIAGTNGLTKTGTGTLVLGVMNTTNNGGLYAVNNNYSGGTFLNAGKIQLTGNSSTLQYFGSGTVTMADGTTIESTVDPIKTISNNISFTSGYGGITSRDVDLTGKLIGDGGLNVVAGGRWLQLSNTANEFKGGIKFTGTSASSLKFTSPSALSTGGLSVVEGTPVLQPLAIMTAGVGVANGISIASAKSLTVSMDANYPLLLSGKVTGQGALIKAGYGTLTLSGTNDYTGGTTVTNGVLTVSGSGTFGASTGALTVSCGILDLANTTWNAGTVTFSDNASNASGGGVIQNGTLNATTYAARQGTVLANLTGGSLSKASGYAVILSGTNSYSGGTTISGGTLVPVTPAALPNGGASGTINVNNTSGVLLLRVGSGLWTSGDLDALFGNSSFTYTASGTLGIDTAGGDFPYTAIPEKGATTKTMGLTKFGAYTLTLSGASGYRGTTTINRGTLRLTGSLYGTSPYSALTFSGTGKFNYDNTAASAATAQNLGALAFSAGEGAVQLTRSVDQNQALTFSSFSRTAGATANFVSGGGANGTTNGFVLTGKAAGFIDQGTFYNGGSYAWMDATGTFVRGLNYDGTEGVTSAGGTTLASATHQQITGPVTVQDTASFTTLNIAGNNNVTLNTGATVSVAGILKTGNVAGGATISGGTGIQALTSGGDMVVRTDGANDAVTIGTPVLANGASSSLTKSGAGTLTLSAANTITGGINLNAGQLNINNTNGLGPATNRLTINDGTTIDNTSGGSVSIPNKNPITINGSFTYLGTSGDLLFPGDNSLGLTMANDSTITVTANTLKIAYSFNATSASLTKDGNGTLWLGNNGSANYSGGLTINAGVVTGSYGQPNVICGTGPVTLGATSGSSSAILNTATSMYHTSPITVRAGSGGIVAITSTSGIGSWGGTVALNRDLTLSGCGGSLYLSGAISGTGGLLIGNTGSFKITTANTYNLPNTGTVSLFGNNTFTGDTLINSGTLALGSLDALKKSTLNTGASGSQTVTFLVPGANTYNLGGLKGADALAIGANTISVGGNDANTEYTGIISSTGGGLTKAGAGKLTLSGANSYTGATQVNAGTLLVNGPGSLHANSAVTVAGGATLGGSGTMNGLVTVSSTAHLSPGTSLSGVQQLIVGSLDLKAGSVLDYYFNSVESGDFMTVNSVLTLPTDGAVTINLSGTLADGDLFDLMQYGSLATEFDVDQLTVGNRDPNLTYTFGTATVGGHDYLQVLIGSVSTVVDGSWTGLSSPPDTLWATPGNWLSNKVPTNLGDSATFSGTAGVSVTLGSNRTLTNLAFGATSGGAAGYTLTGSTLILGSSEVAAAVSVTGTGSHTIASDVTLAGDTTVTTSAADSALTVSGNIDGAGILTKDGPGTLVLSGSNNYSGGTTVTGGTLTISSAGALPSGRSLSIGSGGTLILGGGMAMGTAAQSAEPVPEPGTLALLAIAALAGVMIWRKRR